MYLRTTKRKNKDGSTVAYYQLAHNYRDPDTGRVKAEVIHNFGRADDDVREDLKRLCSSIARVCDLDVRDAVPGACSGPLGETVLPADVERIETRALGSVWVIRKLWERLGLDETIRAIAERSDRVIPYEAALFAMTANRLCDPESKLGVWDRWLPTVHLPECRELKLPQFYEAMDFLHEHAEQVERAVFGKLANLLNLHVDVIFYDTTTCEFSIDDEDEDDGPRRFGHSKSGTWTPQVVVALAVTKEGYPVKSWVFPGNTSDVATVERVRRDLRGWKLNRALFVADSGMNSIANREELARACGTYLLASRTGSETEIQERVLSRRGRYRTIAENLKAKEVIVGEGVKRRRYIVCYNPREAERSAEHRRRVIEELKQELARHPKRSADARWAMKLLTSRRYGRYLTVDAGRRISLDREAIARAERMDGKWVLITNDDTLSTEDAAVGYRNLMVIERCFRTLKRTNLRMNPVHHWLPRRIEAHVKICVLALLIERIAEVECGRSWSRLRHALDRLQATEYRSKKHVFFERNNLRSDVREILKKLKIPAPHGVLDVRRTDQNT